MCIEESPPAARSIQFENKESAAGLSFPNNGTRAIQDIIIFKLFILFLNIKMSQAEAWAKTREKKGLINETQYFDNGPPVPWEFYISRYQPCQQWLKDSKDSELSFDDILHNQKIIVALTETARIMKEIAGIGIE